MSILDILINVLDLKYLSSKSKAWRAWDECAGLICSRCKNKRKSLWAAKNLHYRCQQGASSFASRLKNPSSCWWELTYLCLLFPFIIENRKISRYFKDWVSFVFCFFYFIWKHAVVSHVMWINDWCFWLFEKETVLNSILKIWTFLFTFTFYKINGFLVLTHLEETAIYHHRWLLQLNLCN